MKSIKNHLSLVIALVSILFSIQAFTVIDRAIESYKHNLATNYSIVVVSNKKLVSKDILALSILFENIVELSPDEVIQRLNTGMNSKNIELLKLTLPKFYRLKLTRYPSIEEIKLLTSLLLKNNDIIKVENFSHSVDTTYKLLLLFKSVISVFAVLTFVVTSLLIFKELRIWQFNHSERMNIMRLFGAPTWMRSVVLFRLAIVDAIIASGMSFVLFLYMASNQWLLTQFESIGIDVVIFNPLSDFLLLLGVAVTLSTVLVSFIIIGHKEEV